MASTTMVGNSGSYKGLVFGPVPGVDILTNPVLCVSIEGREDEPELRNTDTLRDQDDGSWVSPMFRGNRTLVMTFRLLRTGTDTDYRATIEAFRAAFKKSDAVMPLYLDDSTMLVFGRVSKRHIDRNREYFSGAATALVELTCPDPRIYDAVQQSQTVTLPMPSGGASWPWVWGVSWGGATTGGQIAALNAGNTPTRPVVTIQGPVDSPTIENLTTGQHLTFGLSLASTDSLTVDLDAHSIVLNGTASRRNALTSDSAWWQLVPGNNTVNYRANTAQVGSTMTMTWRSAWM